MTQPAEQIRSAIAGLDADPTIYVPLLTALIESGLVDDARQVVEDLVERRDAHVGRPLLMIACWRGGPEAARELRRLLDDGTPLGDALREAADEVGIPDLPDIVQQVLDAYRSWAEELDCE